MASSNAFTFTLNGRAVHVENESTHTTVLQYLRKRGFTGTKEGCAEGDCGACTVALVDTNARGERTYRAINSCIAFLPSIAGREIVTVEGVRDWADDNPAATRTEGLHPVQAAMVRQYGSQCGYCTPGFIMSMFEAYYRTDLGDFTQLGDQLNGNLCRCTGYRPIRDAIVEALALNLDAAVSAQGRGVPVGDDLFQVRLSKSDPALPALDYAGADVASREERFSRPTTLRELLEIKSKHGAEVELVAGATELGVYVNKMRRRYPHLVSTDGVRELAEIQKKDDAYWVGGAATLTALEEALGGEYPMIDKMLWAFASRQIRNRATLAGNIVTASPIGDMPPLLLALDAKVMLEKKGRLRTVPIDEWFVAYRKTVIEADEIVRWVTIPRLPADARRRMDSYKVSKRRELDISIASAAFIVETDERDVIVRARLAYGGVAATPLRAKKTEAMLVGKAWSDETCRAACEMLEAEFSPIDDHRSGAAFRRGLAASLFEKFFRGEASSAQDDKLTFETRALLPADGAGRELKHESAVGHVTGGALYVDDVAQRRDMLDAWPVTSPHARAKVVSVDVSRALASPGVVRVLTAADVPGMNDVGAVRHDEPLFAQGEVSFHGHIVAFVLATSVEAARRGAELVSVTYEELEPVLGLRDAIAKGSYHSTPHVIRRGDVDGALSRAPRRLSGRVEIGGQEHFYLESQAAWAEPGEDGEIFVCSSTQHPSEIQAVVAHVLDLPRGKVTVQAPRMGGGFGGKETQGNTWAALCALGAQVTGRPVRIQLDRDVDMQLTGKRHPFHATFDVGFDDDGVLLGARVSLVADGGWALDLSESICDRALFHLDNAYYVPACEFSGRVAKTHTVSHTAYRGFGGPQGMLVIEEILARIAQTLGLEAEAVRERNLYRGSGESNTTHYGQDLGADRIQRIWASLKQSAELDARRASVRAFNAGSRGVKRGLAMTPVKFGISFTATWLNQAGALVLVYRDGSVHVNHGGTEMGQGLYTKLRGVAMRELGVREESVRMMKTQTDKVPNTSATAASSGSDLNGQAVRAACETLRERLAPHAAELIAEAAAKEGRTLGAVPGGAVVFADGKCSAPGVPGVSVAFESVVERAYMRQVSLSATGFYRTPGIGYDRAKGRGKPFYYFAYGAAVAEVEVDGYSGMKRVVRVDILHDVGESLNPGVDRGQIEGAFVQGMGWLTGEELKWDAKGKLLTHSASTYQIPTIGDAPEQLNVELLPNAPQDGVIHGSKAVGEPPFMLAFSVREAIRDAIRAFGPGGVVELPSPVTHEVIFHAVRSRTRDGESGAQAAQ